MTEDEHDIEVARRRLREIRDDPICLVMGKELEDRLAAMGEEDQG